MLTLQTGRGFLSLFARMALMIGTLPSTGDAISRDVAKGYTCGPLRLSGGKIDGGLSDAGGELTMQEKAKRNAAAKSAKFKEWLNSRREGAKSGIAAGSDDILMMDAAAGPPATPSMVATVGAHVGIETPGAVRQEDRIGDTTTFRLYAARPHPKTGVMMVAHVHSSARTRLRAGDLCLEVEPGGGSKDELGFVDVVVIPSGENEAVSAAELMPAAELVAVQVLEGKLRGGLLSRLDVMHECLRDVGEVSCTRSKGRWRVKGHVQNGPRSPARDIQVASPAEHPLTAPAVHLIAPAADDGWAAPRTRRARELETTVVEAPRPQEGPDRREQLGCELQSVKTASATSRDATNEPPISRGASPPMRPRVEFQSPSSPRIFATAADVGMVMATQCDKPLASWGRALDMDGDDGGLVQLEWGEMGGSCQVSLRDYGVKGDESSTPEPLRRARACSGKRAFGDMVKGTPLASSPWTAANMWGSAAMVDDGESWSEVVGTPGRVPPRSALRPGGESDESDDVGDGVLRAEATEVLRDHDDDDDDEDLFRERGRPSSQGLGSRGSDVTSRSRLKPPQANPMSASADRRVFPDLLPTPHRRATTPLPTTPARFRTPMTVGGVGARQEGAEVLTWLEGMGLGMYGSLLIQEGWDSLEVVASLTEPDLHSLGVRGGHARKMMLRLPKYL